MSRRGLIVLGDQLFHYSHYQDFFQDPVFMCEDIGLCTHFRYHKKKLILFLSAMRHFAEGWPGQRVQYCRLEESGTDPSQFFAELGQFIEREQLDEIHSFEVSDRFFRVQIEDFFAQFGQSNNRQVKWVQRKTPGFLNSLSLFDEHKGRSGKPFMKSYYELVRRRTGILMEAGKPQGGRFSFDSENRRAYKPKDRETCPILKPLGFRPDEITLDVMRLVGERFPDHPGDSSSFAYPVTHSQARKWLQRFLDERLKGFGPFEDAILKEETVLFHSLLSPLLNVGLLTPNLVLQKLLEHQARKDVSIESVEGFLRQLMGWREFVRAVYERHDSVQREVNFFNHRRRLTVHWYDGTTGLPVLDTVIRRVQKFGYCHHIERLMVLSNLMLLCRIDPIEVHRWFMEMFVDSADWVMGPNVFGMGQMSDGGLFATKPYICGSNYLLKMSNFEAGEWCETLDGLYWSFISDHRAFFSNNPRLGMMVKSLDRMDAGRKARIFQAAHSFIEQMTH